MRGVVSGVPKCMAPVAGRPFLWYLLRYLSLFDVERVVLSVGYLREVVTGWVGAHGSEFPFGFGYAAEAVPLGTGGGVRLALGQCRGDDVAVMNGDTFFDVDLDALFARHRSWQAAVTLALKPMGHAGRYGSVLTDGHRVAAFAESRLEPGGAVLVSGGVYVVSKARAGGALAGRAGKFSFEADFLRPRCARGDVCGVVQDGYFIDIGVPEDYRRAGAELPSLPFFA